MAVIFRLSRTGKTNAPRYRVTVADSRRCRDGKFLEQVGWYNPTETENNITLDWEKIDTWMKKGAKPSETVAQLFKRHPRTQA